MDLSDLDVHSPGGLHSWDSGFLGISTLLGSTYTFLGVYIPGSLYCLKPTISDLDIIHLSGGLRSWGSTLVGVYAPGVDARVNLHS